MKMEHYRRLVYINIDAETTAALTADDSNIDSITIQEGLNIPLPLLRRSGNQPGEIPTSGWYIVDIIHRIKIIVTSVKRVYSMDDSHVSYLISKVNHAMGLNYIPYGFVTLIDPASKEQIRVMTGTGWVDESFDIFYDSNNHNQIVLGCLSDPDEYNAGIVFCSNQEYVEIGKHTFQYFYERERVFLHESNLVKSIIRSMAYELKHDSIIHFMELNQSMRKDISIANEATSVFIKNKYLLIISENNVTGDTLCRMILQPTIRDINNHVILRAVSNNGNVTDGVKWLPMLCEYLSES